MIKAGVRFIGEKSLLLSDSKNDSKIDKNEDFVFLVKRLYKV